MKITFVYAAWENLGIEYLSAILKEKGHDTELVFDPQLFDDTAVSIGFLKKSFSYEKKVVGQIVNSKPDLVAFSVVSSSYVWSCKIARQVKKRLKVPVVFGGIHPTSVPDEVIKKNFIDFVVVGEGFGAMPELAECLEKGKSPEKSNMSYNIQNVWFKKNGKIIRNKLRPLVEDLDSLPFPDKDLYYQKLPYFKGTNYTTITGLGCPFSCTYCNNSILKKLYMNNGKYLRRRSVDNVIRELKERKHKYKIKGVIFQDEIFIYDLKWLEEFSAKYKKEVGIPFFCWVHPGMINGNTVNLLKSAGCQEVDMGIQTMSPETRKEILHRNVSNKQIKQAIRLLRKAGIWITTDNIFGLPGQTEEELLEMARFYSENRVGLVSVYWLSYFPKTEIVDIARKRGILDDSDIYKINNALIPEFCVTKNTHISSDKIKNANAKNFSRIKNLVYFSAYAPKKLVSYIIKKRIFKLFPSANMFMINAFIARIKNMMLGNKRVILTDKISYQYLYFVVKKIIPWKDR
ncbi:B12-binding domain-containing radical SAM protein [Candidatus Woesearchaeota archaeon]|nr:B12-binding domain-containing radical SAM protein [Candidatus Woesearchaeota archaeon]